MTRNEDAYPVKLLDKSAVSRMLGVSQRQVDVLRQRDGMPWVQLGRRVLFDPAKIVKWIESKTENGGTENE